MTSEDDKPTEKLPVVRNADVMPQFRPSTWAMYVYTGGDLLVPTAINAPKLRSRWANRLAWLKLTAIYFFWSAILIAFGFYVGRYYPGHFA